MILCTLSLFQNIAASCNFHLGSCGGSVAVEFSVGLDVVGVYRQGLGVQLVGSLIVVVLESLVTLLLLGF